MYHIYSDKESKSRSAKLDITSVNTRPGPSAGPDFTLSDAIGDGGFVYHIWPDSDRERLGIGRERPSFTNVCLPELYKQSGDLWEM